MEKKEGKRPEREATAVSSSTPAEAWTQWDVGAASPEIASDFNRLESRNCVRKYIAVSVDVYARIILARFCGPLVPSAAASPCIRAVDAAQPAAGDVAVRRLREVDAVPVEGSRRVWARDRIWVGAVVALPLAAPAADRQNVFSESCMQSRTACTVRQTGTPMQAEQLDHLSSTMRGRPILPTTPHCEL